MLLNCGVGKNSWESLGLQGDPKGNQSWIFIGRTDAEAETLILWPPDVKNWLIWKDPDPGKDWKQEEKEMTEDEMVGWHHRLDGHEFEQASGVGDGQGSLACCSPWGHKESNTTEWLNWPEHRGSPDLHLAPAPLSPVPPATKVGAHLMEDTTCIHVRSSPPTKATGHMQTA